MATPYEVYNSRRAADLKYYLGQRGLGLHPCDVEIYLGKRVSVYSLTKAELVDLHIKLDGNHRGLGLKNVLSPN